MVACAVSFGDCCLDFCGKGVDIGGDVVFCFSGRTYSAWT